MQILKKLQKEVQDKMLSAFYYDENRKAEVEKLPNKTGDKNKKTPKGLKDFVTKKLLEIHKRTLPIEKKEDTK